MPSEITTAAELDALPVGSVVRNESRGLTAERIDSTHGAVIGVAAQFDWRNFWSPGSRFIVLYRPDRPAQPTVPGPLRWEFDGGRGAVLNEDDLIVGYLPASVLPKSAQPTVQPSREKIARIVGQAFHDGGDWTRHAARAIAERYPLGLTVQPTVEAEVKAQAWDEGCRAAEQFYKVTVLGQGKAIPAPMNPYRSEADHEH